MTSLDTALVGIARGEQAPVFREPWEAQSFAMTLALHRAGWFQWHEWAAMLAEQIERARAAGDPDTGDTYYRHWQATLERMIIQRGLSDARTIDHYTGAWVRAAHRTPHGTPIELMPGDFQE